MKVAIIGSRGIPASYGGFETFAEEISVRLKEKGIDVTVVCQKSENRIAEFKKVRLLYSKYSKANNPLKFYFDSLRIRLRNADLILICGVGGAIFYPLLKKKGKIFITHVDGREELRGKYSLIKKIYVRAAQAFTAKFSDYLIADGFAVRKHWLSTHPVSENKISAIEFGANIDLQTNDDVLTELNLEAKKYFLVVCRMVPENNLEMILKGFLKSGSSRKLVLVGEVSGKFGNALKEYSSTQIIFCNSIYNQPKLFSLRKKCFAYIHGHSVGGTNPSLLEAMAAGNICICHDNEFNRETTESKMQYFKSENELAEQIKKVEDLNESEKKSYSQIGLDRIRNYYNWDRITDEYLKLFSKLESK